MVWLDGGTAGVPGAVRTVMFGRFGPDGAPRGDGAPVGPRSARLAPPALATLPGHGYLVAWIEAEGVGDTARTRLLVRALDDDGSTVAAPREVASGVDFSAPVLVAYRGRPSGGASGAALRWAADGDVCLSTVNPSGDETRAPEIIGRASEPFECTLSAVGVEKGWAILLSQLHPRLVALAVEDHQNAGSSTGL